jgi:hypothetical protein
MEQTNPTERLVLDTRELQPFEIGAKLDSLLCYSTWSVKRREKIVDAICGRLFAFTIDQDPAVRTELRREYPKYARSNRTKLDSLDGRREKALKIGLAFLPMLKEPATGELPQLYGEKRRLTLREIVGFIWPERQGGPNFDYEEWLKEREKDVRACRPIAHLAAAYQWIARERAGQESAAEFDYQDLGLHREAVRRANEFAGYFRSTPALKMIADQLIEIAWRE